jgi:translation initiation factor 3 subunit H
MADNGYNVYDGSAGEDGAGESQPRQPIREVLVDGLAALKIVKHCNDNIPTSVVGLLLGLDYSGVLEISYSFPVLGSNSGGGDSAANAETGDELAREEYQEAMMRMLEQVDVDSNAVGWYLSTNFGATCTNDVITGQYSYQSTDMLSTNTVVIIYDPILSKNGKLVLRAFRLSDKYMDVKRRNANDFVAPNEIMQELPVKIKNVGHVAAYLRCLQDSHKAELDNDFTPLSLASNDTFSEKHLELLGSLLDEFVQEQQRFIVYSKSVSKSRQEHLKWLMRRFKENNERQEAGEELLPTRFESSNLRPIPDAPPRNDALVQLGQLNRYCDQLNDLVDSGLHKLTLTSQLNQQA